MTAETRLRLRAEEMEDLEPISALMQDMVVRVDGMVFLPSTKRFVMLGHRYRWEAPDQAQRVHAVMRAEGVRRVRARGFEVGAGEIVLNVLSLAGDLVGDTVTLNILCSEALMIRLEADRLDLWLEDVGEPYPARATPAHGDA